jgi:hypothetical protein
METGGFFPDCFAKLVEFREMHLFGKSSANKPKASPADAILKLSEQEKVSLLMIKAHNLKIFPLVVAPLIIVCAAASNEI